jgi:hypothetical protein
MTTRNKLRDKFLLLAAVSVLALTGCSEDMPLGPIVDNESQAEAPVLPDASKLKIDLGFFEQGRDYDKIFARQNFFNAYLRALVVTAMTELVLAPPVGAFSLAVHTVPSHQPDGSWLWVYTCVNGADEAQVRLRGTIAADGVDWELRVSIPQEGVEQELWFDGSTRDDGDVGLWTFYDFNLEGRPAVAELAWQYGADETYLRLTALYGEDEGDELEFSVAGDEHRIDYDEGDSLDTWFIRWLASDGSGSLRVPDYNGGAEACWDEEQYDVDCG